MQAKYVEQMMIKSFTKITKDSVVSLLLYWEIFMGISGENLFIMHFIQISLHLDPTYLAVNKRMNDG